MDVEEGGGEGGGKESLGAGKWKGRLSYFQKASVGFSALLIKPNEK